MEYNKNYCGYAILVGRTNVGKSTILNKIIKKNISIVSHKCNTTQKNIIGIHTYNNIQSIIIDSPGLKKAKNNFSKEKKIKNIYHHLHKFNIVIVVLECLRWTEEEKNLFNYIKNNNINFIIVINKIDRIYEKNMLLPYIKNIYKKTLNNKIFLISAKKDLHINILIKEIQKKMPINSHQYSKKKKEDSSKKFIISEIIRETLLNFLNQEIPYYTKIYISKITKNFKKEHIINAIILVPNIRYKKIIIGTKGKKIKRYNIISREKIEKFFGFKVHLILWVKLSISH